MMHDADPYLSRPQRHPWHQRTLSTVEAPAVPTWLLLTACGVLLVAAVALLTSPPRDTSTLTAGAADAVAP